MLNRILITDTLLLSVCVCARARAPNWSEITAVGKKQKIGE